MCKTRIWKLVRLLGLAVSSFGMTVQALQYPPQVVANVALTGQGNAIPATTLMTFKTNLYRVNMYFEMVTTTADCGSSIAPTFQWVDDAHRSRSKQIGLLECFNLGFAQTTFIVHGIPGTALTYSVLANPVDTIQYNLYITVEQLQ